MVFVDSLQTVYNGCCLCCGYFNDIVYSIYNTKNSLIEKAISDTSTANSSYYNIKRDDFSDFDGRFNTLCMSNTTSWWDSTGCAYINKNEINIIYLYRNYFCCLEASGPNYVCDCTYYVTGTDTRFCKVCDWFYVRTSTTGVVNNLDSRYCYYTCYCDYNINDFEEINICATLCGCNSGSNTQYLIILNTNASCCCFARTGTGNDNASFLTTLCRVSDNTYNVYCNGTCLCQISDITTEFCFSTHIYGCVYSSSTSAQAWIEFCSWGLCSKNTCITGCNITNSFCPSFIHLYARKYGNTDITYDIYDGLNNNELAKNIPINTTTNICPCTLCIKPIINLGKEGSGCILNWGYLIN